MRVFNGATKAMIKAIAILNKVFGISSDIYKPLSINTQHGYLDDDVNYESEPYYSGNVLIPAFFRKKDDNLSVLDPYYDASSDGIIAFLPSTINLSIYSKIVTRTNQGISNYIVKDVLEIIDGDQVIFRKYILVSSMSIDIDNNREELVNKLEEEPKQELVVEDNLTPNDIPTNTKYNFDPIK